MKNARYKIYKQIGIQELVPFKLNVKLFKQLIIAKFIFLYFFQKEHVNKKYNKIRRNLFNYLKYKNFNLTDLKYINPYKFKHLKLKNFDNFKLYHLNLLSLKLNKKMKYKNKKWIKRKLKQKKLFIPKKKIPYRFDINKNLNLNNYNKWTPFNVFHFFIYSKYLYLKINSYKKIIIKNQLKIKIYKVKYLKLIKLIASLMKKQYIFLLLKNYKFKFIYKLIYLILKKKNLLIYNIIYLILNNYKYLLNIKKKKKKLKLNITQNKNLLEIKTNKLFWFLIAQYFIMSKNDLVSKEKKPFYKVRIRFNNLNKFVYRKYLSELNRSQMFIRFVRFILNYKQQKQIKKFFIQMYRRKYYKQNFKLFHNINSFYKIQKTILLILNDKKNKDRRTIYDYNKTLIRLFQIKIGKILYKLKKTRDYLKILMFLKKKFIHANNLHTLNYSFITWIFKNINDVNFNKNILSKLKYYITYNHKNLSQLQLLTMKPQLGDVLKFTNSNINFKTSINKMFFFYLHFYLMLLYLFLHKKLNLFYSFGSFTFFFEMFLYKFTYVILYHLHKYYKINKNKLILNKYLIEKKIIIYNYTSNQYENLMLNDLSIIFNTKPIYIYAPFSLEVANLNAFYQLKFKKKKNKKKDQVLNFLNFFNYLPYNQKMIHNQFHIMRYYNFIKTIKQNIISFLQYNFLYNNKSILLVNLHNNYNNLIVNQTEQFKNPMNLFLSGQNIYELESTQTNYIPYNY